LHISHVPITCNMKYDVCISSDYYSNISFRHQTSSLNTFIIDAIALCVHHYYNIILLWRTFQLTTLFFHLFNSSYLCFMERISLIINLTMLDQKEHTKFALTRNLGSFFHLHGPATPLRRVKQLVGQYIMINPTPTL
jgi:hypothetical protein